MPRKYAKRKYQRKKKTNWIATPNQGLLVAPRQLVRFKYKDTIQLNATATNIGSAAFRANGLWDPNASAGGHSVLGFDEWSNFYNHYTVLGSKIKATFFAAGSTPASDAQIVGICTTAGSAPVTSNADSFLEQKYLKKAILTGVNAKGVATVNNKCSIKKFLGQKNLIMEDDNTGILASGAGTDPQEQVYYQVFACPYTPFIDPNSVNVVVEIEYIVMLHEPRQLTQS